MSILKLDIYDRTLKISQDHNLYSDGKNVDQVQFNFDSEWDAYAKVAVFYVVGRDNVIYERPVTDPSRPVKIPNECLLRRGNIKIGIVGTRTDEITLQVERITTNTLTYLVKSGMASFENYVVPDDTLWDHYVALMNAATLKAEHANDQSAEIQEDVTQKWIDSKGRHEDIVERHGDIENRHEDIQNRHTNILERHIDIQERHADIIEANDRTEYNTLVVKRLKEEIDEIESTIVLQLQKVSMLADEVSRNANQVAENTQLVADLTGDNHFLYQEVRAHAEVIHDRHADVVKRHNNITEQHNAIHQEHRIIHEEVKHFREIDNHASHTLSQIRRAVHEQGQVLSRVARHAKEAAQSEINARQSEINALDSELSAKDSLIYAKHEAKKAHHYARDTEVQAALARQFVGAEIPEFVLDTETMSLYIKEPELSNAYQLQFKMEGNRLLWNFAGYEAIEESQTTFSNREDGGGV